MGRPLDLYDVAAIDPALGQSLERLAGALAAWRAAGAAGPLLVDGCPVEDLCLAFTLPGERGLGGAPGAWCFFWFAKFHFVLCFWVLPASCLRVLVWAPQASLHAAPPSHWLPWSPSPAALTPAPTPLHPRLTGYPDHPLRPGGADVTVDAASLPEYLAAVVDATLGAGVAPQLGAFRAGFQEVVPLAALEAFYEDEIEVGGWVGFGAFGASAAEAGWTGGFDV
jgi:hypothetical protein